MLQIKLSVEHDEHILSAWMRYNLRSGFAHMPFDNCLNYWGLPKQHLKAQRVAGQSLETIVNQVSIREYSKLTIMLEHTNARLWSLSSEEPIQLAELSNTISRPNLENAGLSFSTNWKLCPKCILEDKKVLGFSYWRRSHQLPSIAHCQAHQEPLFSQIDLLQMKQLALPEKYLNSASQSVVNESQLIDWSLFVAHIDNMLKAGSIELETLRQKILDHLKIKPIAKFKDRSKYQDLSNEMFSDIGKSITSHLFTLQKGKYQNVIWQLLSGKDNRSSLINPVYWLVVMYWLRNELRI